MRNNYGQPHGSAGALCCFTAVAPLANPNRNRNPNPNQARCAASRPSRRLPPVGPRPPSVSGGVTRGWRSGCLSGRALTLTHP